VFNFFRTPPIGDITKCRNPKNGNIRGFSPSKMQQNKQIKKKFGM